VVNGWCAPTEGMNFVFRLEQKLNYIHQSPHSWESNASWLHTGTGRLPAKSSTGDYAGIKSMVDIILLE